MRSGSQVTMSLSEQTLGDHHLASAQPATTAKHGNLGPSQAQTLPLKIKNSSKTTNV
jgi:hypothetical protein